MQWSEKENVPRTIWQTVIQSCVNRTGTCSFIVKNRFAHSLTTDELLSSLIAHRFADHRVPLHWNYGDWADFFTNCVSIKWPVIRLNKASRKGENGSNLNDKILSVITYGTIFVTLYKNGYCIVWNMSNRCENLKEFFQRFRKHVGNSKLNSIQNFGRFQTHKILQTYPYNFFEQ